MADPVPHPAEVRAFVGEHILTMDATPGVEAVVTVGDRIEAVGPRALLAAYPGADVIELGDRTLLPGFIDAHHHLCLAALQPLWVDARGVADLDELAARLRASAADHPERPWVRAVGWDDLTTGLTLTRDDLDAIGLDRPVVVAHYSLHQAAVCSRALDELRIGAGTPDPPGGIIERDTTGRPTGVLLEQAWSTAHRRSLEAVADPDRWGQLIERRAKELLASGITCVHDAACPPEAEQVYARLARDGRLPVSVLTLPHPAAILGRADPDRLDGPPTGEGDEQLRVGPLKLFADGGVRFAVDITVGGAPFRFGLLMPGLADDVAAATARGWQVAVHAQGNVGIRATLDAFLAATSGDGDDRRWRVEHATLLAPQDAVDLARTGAVAVVQPGFVDHMGAAVEPLRPDVQRWLPFRTMADHGVPLAASSDDPCTYSAPLLTSARGATRITGSGSVLHADEAVPYVDWLRAYTAGAAYAGRQEHERGALRPGLRADLVVLRGELDPRDPPEVEQTWVGGELVHRGP